jgi:hypothetical protein
MVDAAIAALEDRRVDLVNMLDILSTLETLEPISSLLPPDDQLHQKRVVPISVRCQRRGEP